MQAFALIMAGVFVHLLNVHPDKTAEYGGAATAMVFLVRTDSWINRDGEPGSDAHLSARSTPQRSERHVRLLRCLSLARFVSGSEPDLLDPDPQG